MIFFIITFVFQTMSRINFQIETISVFETAQSRLDDVFSLWYKGDTSSKEPVLSNLDRTIIFPSKKIVEDEKEWLESEELTVTVTFATPTNLLTAKVGNGQKIQLYHDNLLKDVQFGFNSINDRTIMATFVFESSNGRFKEEKYTKFRTIN